ncbi:MAG: holo-ACP synthase [Planctomycetota bacterium]|nr:holo-ACP synthase [Planctomycetota bacterium]
MRIIGHGIDITPIERIAEMIERHGDHFLARVYTSLERDAARDKKRNTEHFAARFAAKEAALKSIGTGWRDGIAWTDVEVVNEPSGRPTLRVHGEAARIASGMGITQWWISLSHTKEHAIASVIAVQA